MIQKSNITTFRKKQSYENQTDTTLVDPMHVAIKRTNITGIQ